MHRIILPHTCSPLLLGSFGKQNSSLTHMFRMGGSITTATTTTTTIWPQGVRWLSTFSTKKTHGFCLSKVLSYRALWQPLSQDVWSPKGYIGISSSSPEITHAFSSWHARFVVKGRQCYIISRVFIDGYDMI